MPETDQTIALRWSMQLMARAFRDLASSFAAIDAGKADRAIYEIEATIARELTAFCQNPPKGVVVDQAAIIPVVQPLREMTQSARHLIQQSMKPRH
jgi:hypothetical protein